jgi:hypothetical protein
VTAPVEEGADDVREAPGVVVVAVLGGTAHGLGQVRALPVEPGPGPGWIGERRGRCPPLDRELGRPQPGGVEDAVGIGRRRQVVAQQATLRRPSFLGRLVGLGALLGEGTQQVVKPEAVERVRLAEQVRADERAERDGRRRPGAAVARAGRVQADVRPGVHREEAEQPPLRLGQRLVRPQEEGPGGSRTVAVHADVRDELVLVELVGELRTSSNSPSRSRASSRRVFAGTRSSASTRRRQSSARPVSRSARGRPRHSSTPASMTSAACRG